MAIKHVGSWGGTFTDDDTSNTILGAGMRTRFSLMVATTRSMPVTAMTRSTATTAMI
jgi:hypothetical protein